MTRKCSSSLEEKFTARNFHSLTSHAHIDHFVTFVVRAHKNSAWTFHLNALFNEHTLIALRNTVHRHPRRRASRRRPGGRIFTVVENHACMQTRLWINSLPTHEVEELAIRLVQIRLRSF